MEPPTTDAPGPVTRGFMSAITIPEFDSLAITQPDVDPDLFMPPRHNIIGTDFLDQQETPEPNIFPVPEPVTQTQLPTNDQLANEKGNIANNVAMPEVPIQKPEILPNTTDTGFQYSAFNMSRRRFSPRNVVTAEEIESEVLPGASPDSLQSTDGNYSTQGASFGSPSSPSSSAYSSHRNANWNRTVREAGAKYMPTNNPQSHYNYRTEEGNYIPPHLRDYSNYSKRKEEIIQKTARDKMEQEEKMFKPAINEPSTGTTTYEAGGRLYSQAIETKNKVDKIREDMKNVTVPRSSYVPQLCKSSDHLALTGVIKEIKEMFDVFTNNNTIPATYEDTTIILDALGYVNIKALTDRNGKIILSSNTDSEVPGSTIIQDTSVNNNNNNHYSKEMNKDELHINELENKTERIKQKRVETSQEISMVMSQNRTHRTELTIMEESEKIREREKCNLILAELDKNNIGGIYFKSVRTLIKIIECDTPPKDTMGMNVKLLTSLIDPKKARTIRRSRKLDREDSSQGRSSGMSQTRLNTSASTGKLKGSMVTPAYSAALEKRTKDVDRSSFISSEDFNKNIQNQFKWNSERNERLIKLREQQAQAELQSTTTIYRPESDKDATFKRLYANSKMKKSGLKSMSSEELELSKCVFRPSISKPPQTKLGADALVNQPTGFNETVLRMRSARAAYLEMEQAKQDLGMPKNKKLYVGNTIPEPFKTASGPIIRRNSKEQGTVKLVLKITLPNGKEIELKMREGNTPEEKSREIATIFQLSAEVEAALREMIEQQWEQVKTE